MERAERALNRALARYDRRGWAYANGTGMEPIYWSQGTSALELVKQARNLAGRLESIVYDGVTA